MRPEAGFKTGDFVKGKLGLPWNDTRDDRVCADAAKSDLELVSAPFTYDDDAILRYERGVTFWPISFIDWWGSVQQLRELHVCT